MKKPSIALWVAVVFGLAGLVACNDKDTDEQQTSASKAVAGQQTTAQKPAEKPEADEGEDGEGPATPAAVAAERPAPHKPRVSSSPTTSTAIRADSYPRNSTARKRGEVLKRTG
jgi:hypothetical protein